MKKINKFLVYKNEDVFLKRTYEEKKKITKNKMRKKVWYNKKRENSILKKKEKSLERE